MVFHIGEPGEPRQRFVVQPNNAMEWRSLVLAYAVIAIVTMTVAISLFVAGYKLILPFSGIECIALGAALYVTARRSGIQEVVTISKDFVVVESGRTKPDGRTRFQRQWSAVVLERSENSWYPSRLLIRSHGQQVEIGRFLVEGERQGLAADLSKALSCFTTGTVQNNNNKSIITINS